MHGDRAQAVAMDRETAEVIKPQNRRRLFPDARHQAGNTAVRSLAVVVSELKRESLSISVPPSLAFTRARIGDLHAAQ
jgi:hypothetical protein